MARLQYAWDVFVSYSSRENSSSDGEWVVRFKRDLESAIAGWLGDEVRVFRDREDASTSDTVQDLVDGAARSAIYVGLSSPSFMTSPYTRRELQAFLDAQGGSDRVFIIEVKPLLDPSLCPPEISDKIRLQFHQPSPTTRVPMQISRTFRSVLYREYILKLALDISRELMALDAAPAPGAPHCEPPAPASAGPAPRVVLLGVSEDHREELIQVADHLSQYKIRVLPQGPLPDGAEEFKARFQTSVQEADLFVQLLDRSPGPVTDGLANGYARHQYDTAKAAGLEILQWRSPALDVSKVVDQEHKRFLNGESVLVASLTAFTTEVRERAMSARQGHEEDEQQPNRIFISHDDADEAFARMIHEECRARRVAVFRSLLPGSARMSDYDTEQYKAASKILFLYGGAPRGWIEAQLDICARARAERAPPDLLAVCLGPPPDGKEVRAFLPGLQSLDQQAGWSLDNIRALL